MAVHASAARAQTVPGAVNPTQLAPDVRAAPRGSVRVAPRDLGTPMPANAARTPVTVRVIDVTGTFPDLAAQTDQITGALRGRQTSLAAVYDAAARLQAAYSDAGYAIVRVDVATADLRRGVFHLAVRDRFIESLDLSRLPPRARALAEGRLAPLIGKRHLMRRDLERQILLLGDIAGLLGSTGTKSGVAPDGLVLIVDARDNLVSVTTGIDNRPPENLGRYQLGNAFAFNNVFGLGEQIHAEGASSTNLNHLFDGRSPLAAFGGGVSLPIGYNGFVLSAAYSGLRTNPTVPAGTFTIPGEQLTTSFDRVSLRGTYPILLTIQNQVRLQAGFEHTDDQVSVGPLPAFIVAPFGGIYKLSEDRYESVRVAGEWTTLFPWAWGGQATSALFYNRGIGGRSGGADVPLSQPGARPNFDRLRLEMRVSQPLPDNWQIALFLRAQTSFGQSLMLPEQLPLDGPDALSGFASGTLSVDRGAVGRFELGKTIQVSAFDTVAAVTPYGFVAAGGGFHETPFVGQAHYVDVQSVGGGVRAVTNFFGDGFQELASLEYARNFSNVPLLAIPYPEPNYRVSFSYIMRYNGNPLASRSVTLPRGAAAGSAWDGFYAGFNSGYMMAAGNPVTSSSSVQANALDVTGVPYSAAIARSASGSVALDGGGALGGAQIGYNLPTTGRFLLGAEADIQAASLSGQSTLTGTGSVTDGVSTARVTTDTISEARVDWLGTIRARLGYFATPQMLLYASGGLAYGGVSSSVTVNQRWSGLLAAPTLQTQSGTTTSASLASGWAVGGGFEWMILPSLSWKAEYLFFDLGARSLGSSTIATTNFTGFSDVVGTSTNLRFSGHILRAGLNYHFNGLGDGLPGSPAAVGVTLPALAAPQIWSGGYVGLRSGYAFDSRNSVSNTGRVSSAALDDVLTTSFAPASALVTTGTNAVGARGGLAGGVAGYNFATDRYVLGAEADIVGLDAVGSGAFGRATSVAVGAFDNPVSAVVTNEKSTDWLGTVRGRAGYLFTPELLGYASGGLAVGGVRAQTSVAQQTSGSAGAFLVSTNTTTVASSTLVGWTVGGGIEWMFAPHVSIGADYLYYDLGSLTYNAGPVLTRFGVANSTTVTTRASYAGQTARAVLSYHFN